MSPEKEQILFDKFPKIFPSGRNVDPRENLMCFGFECDDGWFDIIYNLCDHLQTHVEGYYMGDKDGSWRPSQITAVQVKEKYGTLRFYYNGGCLVEKNDPNKYKEDHLIDGIVSHACFLSSRTCEVCGNKGKVRGGGWVKCLCENCAKELGYYCDDDL
jgi:hypothetical protein